MRAGRSSFGLYLVGFLLVATLTASLLHDLAEGGQRSMLPLWKLWVPVAVLAIAVVLTIFRERQLVCDSCETAKPAWLWQPLGRERSAEILAGSTTRRLFLRGLGAFGASVATAVGGLAVAVGRNKGWLPVANDFFMTKVERDAPNPRPEWGEARIKSYRRLGTHQRDGVGHLPRLRADQRRVRRAPRHRTRHHLLRHRTGLLRHGAPRRCSAKR